MKIQLRILEILMKMESLTMNQIAKQLNETYSYVNRVTNTMIKEGLLKKEIIGHSIRCSLNKENEKTKALLHLMEVEKLEEKKAKEMIFRDLEQSMKDKEIKFALVFGSYAKGQQTKSSDIDILIVMEKKIDLQDAAKKIYAQHGIEINPILLTPKDFKRQKEKALMKDAIKNHIIIKGFDEFVREI